MRSIFTSALFLIGAIATAQVQVSKPIQLNGSAAERKITDLADPSVSTAPTDAVNSGAVQKGSMTYAAESGSTANAYVVNLTPAPTALTAGMMVNFRVGAGRANTGAVTLQVSALTPVAIKKAVTVDLSTGDILAGQLVSVMYDGTSNVFQLLSRGNTEGTVTSITAGNGLTGGTINSSGTIALSGPVSITNGGTNTSSFASNNKFLVYDGTRLVSTTYDQNSFVAPAAVSGTASYIPKFTGTNAIGNSLMYDNGTSIGIGTTSPTAGREVHINSTSGAQIRLQGTTANWEGLEYQSTSYDGYTGMDETTGRFFIDMDSNGDDFVVLQNGNTGIGGNTPAAKLDISAGADNNGLNDQVAIALQYRSSGGYRHFIRSRHNSALTGDGNDIDFFVNNSGTSGGSTAPGTGNIQVMTLESNNGLPRVGIGTSAPAGPFDVNGVFTLLRNSSSNYYPQLSNGVDGGANSIFALSGGTSNNGSLDIKARGASGYLALWAGGANGAAATAEVLRVAATGRLGVSTGAPAAKLDISGGADSNGGGDEVDIALQYRGGGGYRHFIRSRHNSSLTSDGNDIDFFINNSTTSGGSTAPGTGNIQVMTLENNAGVARVGIGTSVPLGPLAVGNSAVSGSDGFIVIGKNNGAGGTRHMRLGFNSGFDFVIGDYGSSNVAGTWASAFAINYATPANTMYLATTGNVGIGNNNPGSKLDVSGKTTMTQLQVTNLPAFCADLNSSPNITNTGNNEVGTWRTTPGPTNLFNSGSHFNVSTGRFTAPRNGYYFFSAQVRYDGIASGYVRLMLGVNGSPDIDNGMHAIANAGSGSAGSLSNLYHTLNISGIVKLAANDYVSLFVSSSTDNNYTIQSESGFTGYLVSDY